VAVEPEDVAAAGAIATIGAVGCSGCVTACGPTAVIILIIVALLKYIFG